jgi:hypothetical protein
MALQHALFCLFLALASVARATSPHAACFDIVVPIEVDVNVTNFNVVPFANTYESKDFLANSIARDANISALVGNSTRLQKTYNIGLTYCSPANPKGLQILTHGIGFDRS